MTSELGVPVQTGAAPAASLEDRRRLDLSLARGIAWTGAMKWLAQLLSWVSTIVIARLLSREDVGIYALATLYMGFVQLVSEFGLGSAIVQRRDLSPRQIAELGGLSVALGVGLWALSVVAAWPVAAFFEAPPLRWIIAAMGATFVTSGLKVLPRALLSRDLRFKQVASLEAAETLFVTAATLSLALLGFRYWALALGGILGALGGTALAIRWRPHPLAWPASFDGIRSAVTFGGHLVGSRIAWYGYSNADFAIVGRVLGTAALGVYQIGWSIATIPVQRVSALVGQVIPAILSSVQHDRAALRRYFLLLTEGLALVTFPFSVGLCLVAEDAVLVLLGAKWAPAIVPLQLLAAYAGVRSVTVLFSHFLVAANRTRASMHFSLLALGVLPPLFWLGTRWGPEGVAAAWIVGYPLVALPAYRMVTELTGTSSRAYLAAMMPAAGAAATMAVAVLGVHHALPEALPRAIRLALDVAVGVLVYGGVILALRRERVRLLVALVRDRRR
ncbi:MAG TPA: lipopolysaccharide biosynthesis protein [Gemmatimonadales bacterium]|nr:lipopolysaccharide biosynthesis protein [Gemmatimonadales bacterium]